MSAGETRVGDTRVGDTLLLEFVVGVLEALLVRSTDALSVARGLVDADLHGVDTHGVARLPAYVRLVERGFIDLDARPTVHTGSGAVMVVDAGSGFGQPVGEFSMTQACELAGQFGIGWVTTRRSNHFGCAGYYSRLAAERGFIALAATNSAAVVAPTRAKRRFLGTNPLAFAAPGESTPGVSLDMSTSAVSAGKLERAAREERSIPRGWSITPDGEDTEDPTAGVPVGGALLPLGSTEEHGSYKGYGLGLMVEILSSTLAGGPFGPGVGPLTSSDPKGPAEISHFFLALDPARFGLDCPFGERVDELCEALRGLPAADPQRPVLVPGEPEAEQLAERKRSGIPVHDSVLSALDELARKVGVPVVDR